jgi:hypothetical protein
MTAPLRVRVYRRPNIDVRGFGDPGPVPIHGGWGWQLWSGDPCDGGQLIDWGIRGTQPDALTAACHHLRRRAQPGGHPRAINYWDRVTPAERMAAASQPCSCDYGSTAPGIVEPPGRDPDCPEHGGRP